MIWEGRTYLTKDVKGTPLIWKTSVGSDEMEEGEIVKIKGREYEGTRYPTITQWDVRHWKVNTTRSEQKEFTITKWKWKYLDTKYPDIQSLRRENVETCNRKFGQKAKLRILNRVAKSNAPTEWIYFRRKEDGTHQWFLM